MLSYLKHQLLLAYHHLRESGAEKSPEIEAIPSPRLRHRVHGSTDSEGYIAVGQACWKSIEELAADAGHPIDKCSSILDFGCGSGRTIRNAKNVPNAWGIDIDPQAIAWCKANLRGYQFQHVQPDPPTEFPDNSFDLIYAISVFTHLDETMQFQWLAELARIAKPGGLIIATVHGDYHRSLCEKPFNMKNGFVFTKTKSKFKKDGLPDFYQDAQHTRAYVAANWSKYFDIVEHRNQGMAGHQDAVVMRARDK